MPFRKKSTAPPTLINISKNMTLTGIFVFVLLCLLQNQRGVDLSFQQQYQVSFPSSDQDIQIFEVIHSELYLS